MYLQSIPNVSEGRDSARISHWVDWWRRQPGVALLDHSSDADHHRSVFTLAGEEAALVEGLVGWCGEVLRSVDLTVHRGIHPRVGVVDVVPIAPLGESTAAVAQRAALAAGERLGRELGQPVYLYAQSAPYDERRRLADLRRGGLEGLTRRLADSPLWQPDFGPREIDPRSGATAVGARGFLVAVNAVLAGDDLETARSIARAVRESSGGLDGVQALGFRLESRRRAQVSMNITDIHAAPLPKVVAAVERLAAERGAVVEEVELIGLVPRAALAGVDPAQFGWAEDRVLDVRLVEEGLEIDP